MDAGTRVGGASTAENLLILSDVHLGSDILDAASSPSKRSSAVDRDLVALLEHYRIEARGAAWRLIIAGDFIDFIGMSVRVEPSLEAQPTEEEQRHGLGSTAEHARIKLRRVAERHADVFAALAAFVADGHALTLVHGNHDIELYWDEVQTDFRQQLLGHAPASVDPAAFTARIEFNPWFFYRDGVAYVEHGHQYDPFCATAHVMTPLSPLDPRRVARGFCDTLLRYVVRQTRGMKEHGHEHVGIAHYLAFGARLGLRGMAALGQRFLAAIVELFRLRRASLSQAARRLRVEHELRIARWEMASRLGHARLRRLLSLQVAPITSSVRGILASLLLDRLALAVLALLLLVACAALLPCVAVCLSWLLGDRWLAAQRKVDPSQTMVERAGQLARLFPAAFVVMGHTHTPSAVPLAEGEATYVNVGSWVEEEPDEHDPAAYRAARTHLVIRVGEGTPRAQFFRWEAGAPSAWQPTSQS